MAPCATKLDSCAQLFTWQSAEAAYNERGRTQPADRFPLQLILTGKDTVIDNDGVLPVLQQGREPGLDVVWYEDQTHSIQLDASQRLAHDVAARLKPHGPTPCTAAVASAVLEGNE